MSKNPKEDKEIFITMKVVVTTMSSVVIDFNKKMKQVGSSSEPCDTFWEKYLETDSEEISTRVIKIVKYGHFLSLMKIASKNRNKN